MVDKEKIYPGDTMSVAYEMRKPDPNDDRNTAGLPATPTSAFVKLLDRQSGEFVELGGTGVDEVDATIEAATGEAWNDKGAIIRYTLPSAFTQTPGDFTLLVTAVFENGTILTEDKIFKVLEYR